MNKDMRAATIRELKGWPGVTMTEEGGKKHPRIVLHYNGETRFVVVSATPSDARAQSQHLAVVRREIRALGAVRANVIAASTKSPKPANPVLRESLKIKEKPMSKENKLEAIFKSIGDLRYSEMLTLSEFLRDVATEKNLRRGYPQSWASTLQAAVDCSASIPLNEQAQSGG